MSVCPLYLMAPHFPALWGLNFRLRNKSSCKNSFRVTPPTEKKTPFENLFFKLIWLTSLIILHPSPQLSCLFNVCAKDIWQWIAINTQNFWLWKSYSNSLTISIFLDWWKHPRTLSSKEQRRESDIFSSAGMIFLSFFFGGVGVLSHKGE